MLCQSAALLRQPPPAAFSSASYTLPLEQAVRLLAPHARIDYVKSQTDGGRLRPLAIYLSGYNEPKPATTESVESESFAVVIEGNTESAEESPQSERLKINLTEERLTLFARRQSLSYVVSEIARKAGLEFDLRYEGEQVVDVDIRDEPLTEALVRLSPLVRVYLRKDLLTDKTTAFRLALIKRD